MDLTKKRLGLLNDVVALVENWECVDFVFADINCNTVAKLMNEKFVFFNSIRKLEQELEDLMDSMDNDGQT